MSEHYESLPFEVPGFGRDVFDQILYTAFKLNASDISLQTGDYVVFMIHGKQTRASTRVLQQSEVETIVNILYEGPNGTTLIRQGMPIDKRYEIRPNRGERIGYRVNIIPARIDGNDEGVSVTLRVLPKNPPSIFTQNVPAEIVENSLPKNGLVTIAGVTSSGKSTLISSVLRFAYEIDRDCQVTSCNRKIATYEAPIEYIYDNIKTGAPKISQTEIGGTSGLSSWGEAPRTAMRRALQIVLIGECRDRETMEGCIDMAQTGHTTLTTLHAGTVSGSFRRMVGLASSGDEGSVNSVTEKLLGSIRLMLVQSLVPKVGGGRVPLREWLVITKTLEDRLFECKPDAVAKELQKEVMKNGTSFGHTAVYLHKEGLITMSDACAYSGFNKSELLKLEVDDARFVPFTEDSVVYV